MQPELPYTNTLSYSSYLPLESLILYLKDNGFSIKPDDYIEILKVVERFKPATLHEAGTLICPLIATNEEEQSRFHIVFEKLCQPVTAPPEPPRSWQKRILRQSKNLFIKKRALIIGIATALVIAVLSWIFNMPSIWRNPGHLVKAQITIVNKKDGVNYQPGDSILLDARASFANYPADTASAKYDWNIGNGWQYEKQSHVALIAGEPGIIQVILRIVSGKNNVSIDTATIQVCGEMIGSGLQTSGPSILGDTMRFDATVSPSHQKKISSIWLVDGDTVQKNTTFLRYKFDKPGAHTVSLFLSPDNFKTECINTYTADVTIIDPKAKTFQVQSMQVGDVIIAPKKIKNWVGDLLVCLFLVTLISSLLLRWVKYRREQAVKKMLNIATPLPVSNIDKKPLFEIPLENHEQQLIVSEPVMNDVMRFMLQRTFDESLALNIPGTVQQTIRSGGIPELVYTNKLRHNDYLVIIDSTVTNSQQLKLFEYLIKTFKHENISIVRFFYQDNFSKFYNEEYPAGFSLNRLSELYKNYTLIIYGNAHHLVYEAYPVIDPEKLTALAEWENKGIVTPVPFKDWSIKEKLIGEQIILLPADAEGQLRLIKAINEKLLRHRDYLASEKSFYSTEKYDFTDTDEIKTYLADEDLFQWICAIAIYPKIRWEVLIELGKAVLQSRGCPEKMNYTNLLKLARMSWLQEGYFPEHTRLELLKQVGVNEEIVARKKLVELFQYADLYFKDSYFFSSEKNIQEITNKFIIHANDPGNNTTYADSKKQFEALWKQNKITDAPLKGYIDNSTKKPWKTPLVDAKGVAVGAKEYFDKGSALPKPFPFTKWIRILIGITGACILLLIIMSKFGNNFAKTGIAKSLGISTIDSSGLVPVIVDISPFGQCLDDHHDSSHLKNVILSVYDDPAKPYYTTASTELADSSTEFDMISQSFSLPYRAIVSGSLKMKITWQHTDSIKNNLSIPPIGPPAPPTNNTTEDTVTQSLVSNIVFTTTRVKVAVTACKDNNSAIIIKYNTPDLQNVVSGFASILGKKGYANISTPQAIFTDSLKVRFYQSSDKTMADSLAKEASSYFKKSYTAVLVSDTSFTLHARFEILVYKNFSVYFATIPPSQLPASLSEIWKGHVNNRLITIDWTKKVIYYSTGSKSDYGTYSVVKVGKSGTNYQIIVQGNNQFRTAFIKNVTENSFDFELCPEIFNSLTDVDNHAINDCGNYDEMEPYYENDATKIFLPLSQQATVLAASENNKVKKQTDVFLSFSDTKKNNINIQYYENNKLSSSLNQLQLISNELNKLNGKQNYIVSPTKKFTATPFDRSYCTIHVTPENTNSQPDPATSTKNGAFQIEFTGSSTTINPKAIPLIKVVGSILEKYPKASIKLSADNISSFTASIIEKRMDAIISTLQQYYKFNSSQVQKVMKNNSATPLSTPLQNGGALFYNSPSGNSVGNFIKVTYSNFPSTFDPNKPSY